MKKKMLYVLLILALTTPTIAVQAQIFSADVSAYRQAKREGNFNTNFKEALKVEPMIGFSSSFAYGNYIDYHRSFHGVSETESTVKGSIQPILFATLGIQARYRLFSEGQLSPLQVVVGLQYQQKGFRNVFNSTYTSPANFTDVTKYVETYRLNYLAVPIQARWGNKYFGSLGFSLDSYLSGSKRQKLNREQSGAGAIESGFKGNIDQTKKLLSTEIKSSSGGFVLGGGVQYDKTSIALQANFSGKTFKTYPDNFKNITLQILFSKTL